jgi:hypothetical protein
MEGFASTEETTFQGHRKQRLRFSSDWSHAGKFNLGTKRYLAGVRGLP